MTMATSAPMNAPQNSTAARPSPTTAARRGAMAVLAHARAEEIEQGLRAVIDPLDYAELRAPETGLVMLRGRVGGAGAPFNLGEASVKRAARFERASMPSATASAPKPRPRASISSRWCEVRIESHDGCRFSHAGARRPSHLSRDDGRIRAAGHGATVAARRCRPLAHERRRRCRGAGDARL